jgi:hypothetical protein
MFITGGRAGQVMYFVMLGILSFQVFNFNKIKALSLIWILTLREWSKGEILDDSAVMAKIDKRLSFAEKLNNIIL